MNGKNKVETCVEIEHLETGLKERCQDTPSQSKNKAIAMGRLMERISQWHADQKAEIMNNARKKQLDAKKPIRTYNFPRGVVVDHRTGKEAPLKDVLKGNLNLLK